MTAPVLTSTLERAYNSMLSFAVLLQIIICIWSKLILLPMKYAKNAFGSAVLQDWVYFRITKSILAISVSQWLQDFTVRCGLVCKTGYEVSAWTKTSSWHKCRLLCSDFSYYTSALYIIGNLISVLCLYSVTSFRSSSLLRQQWHSLLTEIVSDRWISCRMLKVITWSTYLSFNSMFNIHLYLNYRSAWNWIGACVVSLYVLSPELLNYFD
jgi:hypothetical protein